MSLSIKKSSFTFTWNIENVSLCELGQYQGIFSPPLKSKALANTEWYLKFMPNAGKEGELSVEVARRCIGKSNFSSLDYELSFHAVDGTVLKELRIVDALKKEFCVYENLFIQQSQIADEKKSYLMYNDVFSVRFRIWTYSMGPEYCVLRTILSRTKFFWNIKCFPKFKIMQRLFSLPTLRFSITLEKVSSCHDSFSMRLTIFASNGKHEDFAHCKIYIIGVDRKPSELFDFLAVKGEKLQFQILTNRDNLVHGKLKLQLQFTFGINVIERQEPQTVSDSNGTDTVSVLSKEISEEDLLQLHKSNKFGDATLVADGRYFQVHKTILCNRSKVFHDLFMEKGQSGVSAHGGYTECLNQEQVIYIQDLHPDILDGMLLYIYTDSFHDWQWDRALRLYEAACNYAIEGLKIKCRSVLMSELSVFNACQILDLADTHKDEDLLQCAWNFICEHDEVVGTKEWEFLHKCKYSLATKLLCEIYLWKPS